MSDQAAKSKPNSQSSDLSPMKQPYAVIVYASEDRAFAVRLIASLEKAGIRCWWDQLIPSGAAWGAAFNHALRHAEWILVIVTPHSLLSWDVNYLLEWTGKHSPKMLIPIFYEPVPIDGLPVEFVRRKSFNMTRKLQYAADIASLLRWLQKPPADKTRTIMNAQRSVANRVYEAEDYYIPPSEEMTRSSSKPIEPVTFTLFNPIHVHKQKRYSLLVYTLTFEQHNDIRRDVRKFADELGAYPKERHSPQTVSIAPKTPLTVVPEAEGVIFDPPELTKTWDEKWLRFNFDFEVPLDYPDEEVLLRVSVQIKGFEVACIKSSCEVVAKAAAETVSALPDDPLFDPPPESGMRTADAHLYRNVFLSYSHKDEEVAWRRARQIEQALGDRVFMDVKDLRAGEDWETRLFEWIDQADIIHLLWSENSAKSDYCRKEWTYALEKKCGDTRCFGVIRPVYWHKPMPDPPPELAHLHFQPIKLEEE